MKAISNVLQNQFCLHFYKPRLTHPAIIKYG
jgi:hypothetical protein